MKYNLNLSNDSSNLLLEDESKVVMAYYPLFKTSEELNAPLLPNPFFNKEKIEQKVKDILNVPDEFLDNEDNNKISFGIECYEDALASKQFSLDDIRNAFKAGSRLLNEIEHIKSLLPTQFILGSGVTFQDQIKNGYYKK